MKHLASGLALALAACGGDEAGPRTSILMLTVDTLRADHLGSYGATNDTSPNIDRLASEGALFEQAMAPKASTWPSLVSLQTGTYPITHGVRQNGGTPTGDVTMLAEIVASRGYRTLAVLTNAARGQWPGFERVIGTAEGLADPPPNYAPGLRARDRTPDERAAELAIEWLREDPQRPFFLWVHFKLPHMPYEPPPGYAALFTDPGYRGSLDGSRETLMELELSDRELGPEELRHLHALYDACIRADDDLIGAILAALDELGRRDDTLVVFTADHGEVLYERGRYLGHAASIHESSLRVPLILRLPGRIPAGQRLDALVELIDVSPTVLDLIGVAAPPSVQGTSLTPLFAGRPLDLGPAFAELRDRIVAARTATHRYVLNPTGHRPPTVPKKFIQGSARDPGYRIEPEELFHVAVDPAETRNLVAAEPELAASLREQIFDWQTRTGWELDAGEGGPIDPELREHLEALGYVP